MVQMYIAPEVPDGNPNLMDYLRQKHPMVAKRVDAMWGTVELDTYLNSLMMADGSVPYSLPPSDGPILLRLSVANWNAVIEKGKAKKSNGHSFDHHHVVKSTTK
jgi:hypothetical protein